jgi:GH35 family endo-1,4-beta-xylanase
MKSCLSECKENRKSLFVNVALVLIVLSTVCSMQARAQSDTIQTTVPALKNVFAKDFTIGCLLSYRNIGFPTDPTVPGQSAVITPNGGYLIKYHMNCMSPGNNMKPQFTVDLAGSASAYSAATTSQTKDSIDIRPIIRFNGDLIAQLNLAKRQGFTFRGHTLVWHSQTPGTGFFCTGYSATGARLSKQKMTERMENYIKEVFRLIHEGWPGLLSAVDVVNEAINDNGTDRTADSDWWLTFQDNSYIMKAFEFARKYTLLYGERQIKLYYNDYSTQVSTKADGIVRLCGPIFRAGFLDGLGMQDHDAITSPTAAQWIATYNKFDSICTEMAVTELDINTNSGTNTPSASVLSQQANQYAQLFKCFVERSYKSGRGKIINVSKDGLNDQYTFVTNQATSLWDTQNQCKPAFYAVANIGRNYNVLDSLIKYASFLTQGTYTTASWSNFTTALSAARTARDQNYSVSVSADAALTKGKDDLTAAINGLSGTVSSVSDYTPAEFGLSQNYPNPFNPTTTIRYQVETTGSVMLKVFDVLGREVATLVNDIQPAGSYTVRWDGASHPSGVYYCRMVAGSVTQTRKMVLAR